MSIFNSLFKIYFLTVISLLFSFKLLAIEPMGDDDFQGDYSPIGRINAGNIGITQSNTNDYPAAFQNIYLPNNLWNDPNYYSGDGFNGTGIGGAIDRFAADYRLAKWIESNSIYTNNQVVPAINNLYGIVDDQAQSIEENSRDILNLKRAFAAFAAMSGLNYIDNMHSMSASFGTAMDKVGFALGIRLKYRGHNIYTTFQASSDMGGHQQAYSVSATFGF